MSVTVPVPDVQSRVIVAPFLMVTGELPEAPLFPLHPPDATHAEPSGLLQVTVVVYGGTPLMGLAVRVTGTAADADPDKIKPITIANFFISFLIVGGPGRSRTFVSRLKADYSTVELRALYSQYS